MPPEYPWEMSRERLLEVLNETMAERDRLREALVKIAAADGEAQSIPAWVQELAREALGSDRTFDTGPESEGDDV